jgi:uncharacterized protein YlaI
MQRNCGLDTEKKTQIIESVKTGKFTFKPKKKESQMPLVVDPC